MALIFSPYGAATSLFAWGVVMSYKLVLLALVYDNKDGEVNGYKINILCFVCEIIVLSLIFPTKSSVV